MNKRKDIVALDAYLSTVMHSPFEWGVTDCVTVVFKCLGAYTGYKISDVLGHWNCMKSAVRYSKSVDGVEQQRRVLLSCGYRQRYSTFSVTDGSVILNFQNDESLGLPDCAFFYGGKLITSTLAGGVTAVRFDISLTEEHWGR